MPGCGAAPSGRWDGAADGGTAGPPRGTAEGGAMAPG